MLTRRRPQRRSEHGQTLIFGLFFVIFFALVVSSVLKLSDVALTQHLNTENTNTTDTGEDGGAAYAAANAGRSGLSQVCVPGNKSTLLMTSGDQVGYTVRDCNPGNTTTITNGGGHCLLCILNMTPGAPTSVNPPCPNSCVLNVVCSQCTGDAITTYGGDDYINGSIAQPMSIQACATGPPGCSSGAHVNVIQGSMYPNPCCSPYPPGTYTTAVPDPLSAIGAPSPPATEPTNCSSVGGLWDATKGCSLNISQGSVALAPGVWNSLKISGQAKVTLQPGVFVLTGTLDMSNGILCGPGTITGNTCNTSSRSSTNGITFYLTCPGSALVGAYQACPTSRASFMSGGAFKLSGQAKVTVVSPSCPDGDVIPCPSVAYGGIAVLADPHLLDVGAGGAGLSGCVTSGGSCAISVSGLGGDFTGSIDSRMAGISIAGNGSQSITDGFMIANSLYLNGSGRTGPALNLSGPGSISATGNCGVSDIDIYQLQNGNLPPTTGRAIIQSQCGSNAASGVVALNY